MQSKLFKIHAIDRKEDKCGGCGKKINPAVFCSAAGFWDFDYRCDDCILKTNYVTEEELAKLKKNFLSSFEKGIILETTWTKDPDKKSLLDYFLKLEDEDKEFINDIDIRKAHMFKRGLEDGCVLFSEKEMFDYFNFYDNPPELVMLLRKLAKENPKSKFFKDMYRNARKGKLTEKQLQTLKRNKLFKNVLGDEDGFWNMLPMIIDYLTLKEVVDDFDLKVQSIATSIMENGFYSSNQRFTIEKYIRNRILKD